MHQSTKIMATLRPDCPKKFYRGMVESGVSLFRLNFNFYDPQKDDEIITQFIRYIREISLELGIFAGICADIRGPTFKTRLEQDVQLCKGGRLTFSIDGSISIDTECPTFYSQLSAKVQPGHLMLVDHAQSVLEINSIDKVRKKIEVTPLNDCLLKTNKNISFPGVCIVQYPITERDKEIVEYAKSKGLDFILQSYVQTGGDILEMRKLLGTENAPLIIAKVETESACAGSNLMEIIKNSDAVLIGRGHLADELSNRLTLPIVQREIIQTALESEKPVFVGTEIYYSMVSLYFPARVDMENVFSMVSDNIDGLMLAGETTNSESPVRLVTKLSEQIRLCEKYFGTDSLEYPSVGNIEDARKQILKKGCYPELKVDLNGPK